MIEILLFCSRDSAESFEQAHTVHEAILLTSEQMTSRVIDKLSSELGDLDLFAQHRVVSTPMIIARRGSEELLRLLSIPSVEEVLSLLRTIM